ncbi:transcriptional regulator, HxlR family [Haloechinothrix alba]|uniref:Transcriptional regulator, HxlR family n=1 Tax=Haloechinothrix alba TaxID=664784 RepID=A0A238VBM9_9PSEU|nr:winged helix-turn-helix transcriptional regulator [Haloechinothrix alba]SNR31666.1 transcriptional regulator, HxlR family [Haloechinothrix alba]
MTGRTYGQFCGLARALELVGERWAMLVVRDLVLGPKRFSDLRETLPRVPSSMLSARLNELEQAGVIRRRVQPHLEASVIYELTEYGGELEPVLLQLGRWGARSIGEPGHDDAFTLDSAILALYATFQPEAASEVRVNYELRFGDMVVHAMVDDGVLKVAEGALPDADLVIETFRLKQLLAGEVTPSELLAGGEADVRGDLELLNLFVELFHIAPAPVPAEGLAVR